MFQHDLFGGKAFVMPGDKRPPTPRYRDTWQEELDNGQDYPLPDRLADDREPALPKDLHHQLRAGIRTDVGCATQRG